MATTKGAKNKKIEQLEATQILNNTQDLKLNEVVEELGTLQVSVQNSLATLTASLTSKLQLMADVQSAIALKEQRLKELHEIEKEAIRLDDIKAQIVEEQQQAELKRQASVKQWEDMVIERDKNWKRDEEEHYYSSEMAKKKNLDEHSALVEKLKREEMVRQDSLNRTWAEREKALAAKEAEVVEMQKQVANFDNVLKLKVNEEKNAVAAVLKQKFDHEVAMLKKDNDAQAALSNTKINAMNEALSKLEAQITDLNTQLAAARQDAKEIASQALVSASGRQVADALQKVVDAKSDSNQKK